MRILVLEDDPALSSWLVDAFAEVGVHCDVARLLSDAELLIGQVDYRLVLVEMNLPDGEGVDLVKGLRVRGSALPFIVITGSSDPAARIAALQCGADDVLVKPFVFNELHARMEAVLRREGAYAGPEIRFGTVCLNTRTKEASIAGGALPLSRREAEVLEPLVRRGGRVVSKHTLESQLFGAGDELGSNAIEVYVHRLRRKLRGAESPLDIRTVRGIGYTLVAE